MIRVKEKLGKENPLYVAASALKEESGFRNLTAHWKDPAISLTSEEMQRVIDKWLEIDKLAKCQDNDCLGWLKYDKSIPGFVCPCRKTKLTKCDLAR